MVKNSLPKVSVIIICEEWNDFLEESLPYYDKLDYRNFEVIVFSTKPIEGSNPTSGRTRHIFFLTRVTTPLKYIYNENNLTYRRRKSTK